MLKPPKGVIWVVGKMVLKRISSTEVWMGSTYRVSLCDLSTVIHRVRKVMWSSTMSFFAELYPFLMSYVLLY